MLAWILVFLSFISCFASHKSRAKDIDLDKVVDLCVMIHAHVIASVYPNCRIMLHWRTFCFTSFFWKTLLAFCSWYFAFLRCVTWPPLFFLAPNSCPLEPGQFDPNVLFVYFNWRYPLYYNRTNITFWLFKCTWAYGAYEKRYSYTCTCRALFDLCICREAEAWKSLTKSKLVIHVMERLWRRNIDPRT